MARFGITKHSMDRPKARVKQRAPARKPAPIMSDNDADDMPMRKGARMPLPDNDADDMA